MLDFYEYINTKKKDGKRNNLYITSYINEEKNSTKEARENGSFYTPQSVIYDCLKSVTDYNKKLEEGKTPFKEIIFRLRKYEMFEKDPVESIKLFLRTLIAIRKNPSFEKWLNYKSPLMNYQDVAIEREDLIDARVELASREKIWSDVGMKGEYVATIQYRDNDLPQYEFWLSDNGDVLVTFAFVPNMEEFFNIENFKRNRFGRTYSVEPRIERCEGFDSKKNSLRDGDCNYLIIRCDGTIKYGPESGDK